MAFDHLVKLVTDFYSEDELMAAKSLLDNYTNTGNRLPRRQGPNKLKATADDIVKVILNLLLQFRCSMRQTYRVYHLLTRHIATYLQSYWNCGLCVQRLGL